MNSEANSLKIPTPEEIKAAVDIRRDVVAMSADNDERRLFIKLACRNGDTERLCFEAPVADALFRHLKKVVVGYEREPHAGARLTLTPSVPWAFG